MSYETAYGWTEQKGSCPEAADDRQDQRHTAELSKTTQQLSITRSN